MTEKFGDKYENKEELPIPDFRFAEENGLRIAINQDGESIPVKVNAEGRLSPNGEIMWFAVN